LKSKWERKYQISKPTPGKQIKPRRVGPEYFH